MTALPGHNNPPADPIAEPPPEAVVTEGSDALRNQPPLPALPPEASLPVAGRSRLLLAGEDILAGLRLWRLGGSLGWLDVRLQFRGSLVGPLWLTLTTAVMVGAMGLVYARLFGVVLHDYLPYLAISMILWQAGVSGVTGEACTCFIRAADSIRSVRLPYSVQILRMLTRIAVTFAFTIVVPLAVCAWYRVLPGFQGLLAIPALGLWIINAFAWGLLLAPLCTRYRDIPPIISSAVQLLFYVTPVIWSVRQLGDKGKWLILNPFYSLLEIVRGPLTGHAPSAAVWAVACGTSLALWLAGLWTFSRARASLAFWI
ncbi:ABC transporter permease [Acetobacter sp. AN02]|uniref:ABC transporter permease n=1 Tax=Acetobacter sp. AN02 TaxID=2894186 RepID=UPI002434491D|nr:ABC transporter permease [Acetobacter sp. AN02]MDG6095459.1 ABC transporter permease [Acetobacter sp. AN02]